MVSYTPNNASLLDSAVIWPGIVGCSPGSDPDQKDQSWPHWNWTKRLMSLDTTRFGSNRELIQIVSQGR